MPIVPALCPNCGTLFSSGVEVGLGLVQFENCKTGPCPKCGETGDILDGFYSALSDSVVQFLAADPGQFKTLIDILRDAQRKRLDAKAVADLISAMLPKLKALAEYIRTNKEDIYKILALLIAAFGFIFSRVEAASKAGLTEAEIKGLIDEAIGKACKTPKQQTDAKKERMQRQKAKLARKAKDRQRKQQRRR